MGRRTEEQNGRDDSTAILLPREPINNKAATEENSLLFAHGATLSDDVPFNYEECLSKAGMGLYQYMVLSLCGLGVASDAIEVSTMSFAVTTTAECDLYLTDSKKGLLSSMLFVGMMCGGLLFGNSADKHGRRATLVAGMIFNGLFGLLSAFSDNYAFFLACRFLSGVGVGGSIPVIFTFFCEILPKEVRGRWMVILAAFWMVGTIVIAALAWGILSPVDCVREDGATTDTWCASIVGQTCGTIPFVWGYTSAWRVLVFVAAVPALLGGIGFIFTPESPRWLITHGRPAQAERVLRLMARINSKTAYAADDWIKISAAHSGPDQEGDEDDYEEDDTYSQGHKETNVDSVPILPGARSPQGTVLPVRRKRSLLRRIIASLVHVYTNTVILFNPPLRRTTLILSFVWFTLCFGFYGLSLWLPNYYKYGGVDTSTDIYLVSFLSALANLPGNIISAWSVDVIGRSRTLTLSMLVSAISVFFIFSIKTTTGTTVFSCVFNAVSVGGWNALNILSTEPYPTKQRGSAYGMLSALGRVAAVLGITAFGEFGGGQIAVPMIIVASTLLGGGFITLLLPNATLKPMEE